MYLIGLKAKEIAMLLNVTRSQFAVTAMDRGWREQNFLRKALFCIFDLFLNQCPFIQKIIKVLFLFVVSHEKSGILNMLVII
jgi:hypothetical protein